MVLLKYSNIVYEGIHYVTILPSPSIPLTIYNHTDQGILYTLDRVSHAKFLSAHGHVTCYWEDQQAVTGTHTPTENGVLKASPASRTIRFGVLGQHRWSVPFNTAMQGSYHLYFNHSTQHAAHSTQHLPPQADGTATVVQLGITCDKLGGSVVLSIDSIATQAASKLLQNDIVFLSPVLAPPAPLHAKIVVAVESAAVCFVSHTKAPQLRVAIDGAHLSVAAQPLPPHDACITRDDTHSPRDDTRSPRDTRHVSEHKYDIAVDLGGLSIHNMMPGSQFPVVLGSHTGQAPAITLLCELRRLPSPERPLTACEVVSTPQRAGTVAVEKLHVEVLPLVLNLEDKLIASLTQSFELYRQLLVKDHPVLLRNHFPRIPSSELPSSYIEMLMDTQFYINHMSISRVTVLVTVVAGDALYLGVDGSNVSLDPVLIQKKDVLAYQIGNALAQHYMMSLVSSSGSVVGSLQLLGNPSSLLRNLGLGLQALWSIPFSHARTTGAVGFLLGIGIGTRAFAGHVAEGTLQSLVSVSTAAARNLQRLSFDQAHYTQRQREAMKPADSFSDGLKRGVQGFASGLWDGLSGIVTSPVKQTRSRGLWGLPSGIGQGLIGAVTKPLGGVFDLVNLTGQGLLGSSGVGLGDHEDAGSGDLSTAVGLSQMESSASVLASIRQLEHLVGNEARVTLCVSALLTPPLNDNDTHNTMEREGHTHNTTEGSGHTHMEDSTHTPLTVLFTPSHIYVLASLGAPSVYPISVSYRVLALSSDRVTLQLEPTDTPALVLSISHSNWIRIRLHTSLKPPDHGIPPKSIKFTKC